MECKSWPGGSRAFPFLPGNPYLLRKTYIRDVAVDILYIIEKEDIASLYGLARRLQSHRALNKPR